MKNNDQTDRLLRVLITILTYAFLSAVVYIPFMGQIGHMSESVIIRSYYEDIEEENCGERQSAKFLWHAPRSFTGGRRKRLTRIAPFFKEAAA